MAKTTNKGKRTLKNAAEKRSLIGFCLTASDDARINELSEKTGLSRSSVISVLLEASKDPAVFNVMNQWLTNYLVARGTNVKKKPVSFNGAGALPTTTFLPAAYRELPIMTTATKNNERTTPSAFSESSEIKEKLDCMDNFSTLLTDNRHYSQCLVNSPLSTETLLIHTSTNRAVKLRRSAEYGIDPRDVPFQLYKDFVRDKLLDAEHWTSKPFASNETIRQIASGIESGKVIICEEADKLGFLHFTKLATAEDLKQKAKDHEEDRPLTAAEWDDFLNNLGTPDDPKQAAEQKAKEEAERKKNADPDPATMTREEKIAYINALYAKGETDRGVNLAFKWGVPA